MSEQNKSAGIISERAEAESARIAAAEEVKAGAPSAAEAYAAELGIHEPRTDSEKREAELIAAMPHEERMSPRTEDELAKSRERTESSSELQACKWDRQEELGEAHEDERIGRILHASTFVQMLWKCGIVCVLTRMNVAGLRSLKGERRAKERRAHFDRTMAGLVISSSRALPLPSPKYVTWVQIPAMIEYSVMRFDERGLPTSEKFRGWRTVLLALIQQGFLDERQCNRVFGEARGLAARRWNEILQSFRNVGAIAS